MNLGRMDPTLKTEEINYLSKVSYFFAFPPQKSFVGLLSSLDRLYN